MRGSDLTTKQLKAAEQYILLRRAQGNTNYPSPEQLVSIQWEQLVMLVAEYGAIRARSVANGGSADEPGEVYLTLSESAGPESER